MSHDLERETPPPPELKGRVIGTLRSRGILRPSRSGGRFGPRSGASPVLRVAAALALFLGGALVGRLLPRAEGGDGAAGGVPAQRQFLIVLEEPPSFQPERPLPDLVREYGAWAGELGGEGRLVAAERLDGWSAVLPGAGGTGQPAPPDATGGAAGMTGFFLVRAEDREAALALARTHPHLAYGGRIVVLGVAED